MQQNRPLLERLAAATSGKLFRAQRRQRMPEAVSFSEAGTVERQVLDLWNMPIVFLLLLAAEEPASGCSASYWGRL